MARGASTGSDEILFGDLSRLHNSRSQADKLAELDPMILLQGSWVEGLDGFSGTTDWLARSETLPPAWTRRWGRENKQMSETGIDIWQSQLDRIRSVVHLDEQANPVEKITFDADPGILDRVFIDVDLPRRGLPGPLKLKCDAQMMKAVEALTGPGTWKYLHKVKTPEMSVGFRQLAYLDAAGNAIGFLHPEINSLPPLLFVD